MFLGYSRLCLFLVLMVTVISLSVGCSTDNRRDLNPLTSRPPQDGSLDKGVDSTYVNFTPPGVLRRYEAFYVEPITFLNQDKGRLVQSTGREYRDLATSFRSKIIRALGSRHTHFNQPATHVAIIRIKVLDMWSTRMIEALRPGILIPNNLGGGATMEAEFVDSISGRVFGKVWDSRPGERKGFFSGLTKWGGTKAAFDEWALLLDQSAIPDRHS